MSSTSLPAHAISPLGNVDMAALSALVLRLELALFGDSLFAFRLFSGIAAAGTVALTGVLPKELGGRSWAVFPARGTKYAGALRSSELSSLGCRKI